MAQINAAIESATEAAIEHATEIKVPKTLRRMLKAKMKDSPGAWDKAIYALASKMFEADDE